MGTTKQIYFQDEINERLNNESNKSALINRLLKEHYEKDDIMQMNKEQLEIELEIRKLDRETKAKLEELRLNQIKIS